MGYSERSKIAKMDLETVLLKVYNVDEITTFYEQFMEGVAADSELRDSLGKSWLINPVGKLIKRKKVEVLMEVFEDDELFFALYSQQSDLCKSALELLVWYGGHSLELLEQRLGTKVCVANKGARTFYEPFLLQSGLELLRLENSHYHYTPSGEGKKGGIFVFLPEPLRDILCKALPKPPDYTLNPLPKKRKTAFSHCSEASALTETVRMVEFIGQGHLALKKNGEATVKGLRDLTSMSGLQEFYPPGSSKELQRVKAELLASFFLGIDLKKKGALSPPQDLLRRIFTCWVEEEEFLLVEKLLGHLRITRRDYYYSYVSWNIKKGLRKLLKALQLGKWFSMENIYNYCVVHRINLLEKRPEALEFHRIEETSYGNWESWDPLRSATIVEVLYIPVLQAFFFLAAALGLVEIDYDAPTNKNYKRPKRDYLSVYDGLQQVCLTKLGAYVVGKTRNYTSREPEKAKAVFTLDTTRLLLTMEGDDPIAALTLEKMLEQMGSGRYMLTFDSLFKDCQSKRDVQGKIALFRKRICNKPPKIWLDFFSRALERVNPLTPEPTFKVFKVEQDHELLQLLASDPDISPLLYKMEGFCIAVKTADIAKLSSRLRRHGYLIAASSLKG
jgi:hypothetical protein